MSDSGPFGSDDPLGGIPFLNDLARMFRTQGTLSWDTARQLGVYIATDGASEPNVDPMVRLQFEQLVRVAELRVAELTGLTPSRTGRGISIAPTTRANWVHRTLDDYRSLLERLADSLTGLGGPDGPGAPAEGTDPTDPMEAMLGGLMQMIGPMMLGMTAGSMVGHLGRRAFGQYDLPVPRPAGDELLVVPANVDTFAEDWSLPVDDVRMWVCLSEVATHTVLSVPHVRDRLTDLLHRYASGFRPDANALEDRLGSIDPSDPGAMQSLQDMLRDPGVLLGAIRSPLQLELLPQLVGLVAVVVGWVDHVVEEVGGPLIGSYSQVTEALHRRRVEADQSDRFVEQLLGLELSQAHYDRGSAFVAGVVERAGAEGLNRLWTSARELPTPAEVDAPGLWLARIDLPE